MTLYKRHGTIRLSIIREIKVNCTVKILLCYFFYYCLCCTAVIFTLTSVCNDIWQTTYSSVFFFCCFFFFFFVFSENMVWHKCVLAPYKTICMNCPTLFLGKNNKKFIYFLSTNESALGVLKVNMHIFFPADDSYDM